MGVYICTDHHGHYPIGVASVVVADNEDQARTLLDAKLEEHGLLASKDRPYTLLKLNDTEPRARVLHDGDY